MIHVKIKRTHINGGLKRIADSLGAAVNEGVTKATKNTQQLAIKFSRGRVAQGIKIEVIDAATWTVKGRVYTTSPFSAFLEYGTGIFMAPNPLGHIKGSAGDRGEAWFVHEDMANLDKYNFPVLDTPTGRYYVIQGTHPHPYMQPAAFQRRNKNVEEVAEAVRKMIRSV